MRQCDCGCECSIGNGVPFNEFKGMPGKYFCKLSCAHYYAAYNYDRVESLSELCDLAQKRKSVFGLIGVCSHRPLPAAVVISMQGRMIQQMIAGRIYVYKKKETKKK